MSQFKVTPMEGLKAQDEVDSEWKDFFSDGEEKEKEKTLAETKKDNEEAYEDDFEEPEKEDKSEKDDKDDKSEISSRDVSQETSTYQDHDDDNPSTSDHPDGGEGRSRKKHRRRPKSSKGRKLSHQEHTAKPPRLDLHPDTSKDRVHHLARSRQNQDAMSDQEVVTRRRGRKLQRRSQMKKYHSMDQAVEQAGRDRLEQKFEELEDLMTRPLTDTRGINVTAGRQRVHGMVQMQHAHGRVGHGSNVSSARHSHRVGAWVDETVPEEEVGDDGQAYSTIRVLQTGGDRSVQLHLSYDKQHPSSNSSSNHAQESRLVSKPPVPRPRRKGSVESSPTSSSGTSEAKKPENGGGVENGYRYSTDEEEEEQEFDGPQTPRRVYLPTDMHIKNSENPKLQDWLKRKNAEYRRAKKAERAKRKEDRNNKMVEHELKVARRERSSERVKEWMEVKRKEAARQQKEERRRRKQETARLEAQRRAKSPAEGDIKVQGIDRPQSAPAHRLPPNYIPVKRPDSAVMKTAKLDHGDGTAPKPPDSKFIYKRPVSGRVKLMKLQNVRNSDVRKAEQKRAEELSAEEKEKRARTSYDAWLLTKRKEDVEKRKEAQRQKELAKSDPELERIIPEMAKRRIDRIKNGKKRIDTGMQAIDNQENARFGGADFGNEDQQQEGTGEEQSGGEGGREERSTTPKPSSYQLAIEGTSASIVELNTRAKPAVAKTHMPIPQSKFSPRHRPQSAKIRPQSAKSGRPSSGRPSSGRVQAVMAADHSAEPNPFKLPFPDDKGVPDHVRRMQEKIFSRQLTESQRSSNSERPEPQGCASAEFSCPKGVDGLHHSSNDGGSSTKSETTPRTSMQLLQEIEAAAEQEAALSGVRSALMKVAESSLEEVEAETVGEEEGVVGEDQEATETVEECVETSIDSDQPNAELSEQVADDANSPPSEEQQLAHQDESTQQEDEEKTKESAEPQAVSPDDQNADTTFQYEEEPEDTNQTTAEDDNQNHTKAEDTSLTQDADTENQDKANQEKDSQEGEDSEDATRKSLSSKHVSFSEDLTTVFEPNSAESSSNFDFEDERGDDNKGEMEYMSLDQAPDPE